MTGNEDARTYGHWIDGADYNGSGLIPRANPATTIHVANFADGTAADVAEAVAAAKRAFDSGSWSRLSGAERSRVLLRLVDWIRENREFLAKIDAQEVGKPLALARGDVDGAIAHFEYAAALAHEVHGDAYTNMGEAYLGLITREPVGVVGLIAPWNFPALSYAEKVAYALAAGCTAVIKPSEFTSGSTIEISRAATMAGLPDGVINVVTGYGHVVGQAIVEHPDVNFVSFTGSTVTGRKIAETAASRLKKVALELGGKGANIVFADANLDDAVDGALFAAFFNSGECCVAGSRLLVQDEIADEFLARLAAATERMTVGFEEHADVGAMIHEQHAERVVDFIDEAVQAGGKVLAGGRRVTPLSGPGAFVEPTVVDNVTPDMRIFRDEIFGPVLTATRFTDADEALRLANDTVYGLGNSVWTKDLDKAMRFQRELRSGTVWINTTIDGGAQMTFGGTKESGYGREVGRAGLEEFTELKSCVIRTGERAPSFG
ncbi:aldehyde dehydrogenase family protein [Aeromicrobium sp. 9AM]|uniref:aldehyde dehydrogenase family protein n=1 Tax=Aeromicrobium sp. 9AM TaxID=2653126 RepID=UPI0012F28006|nr:aldehyde dehydrogenase family protein [Aeromicrobium sp. 9AM]VXB09359.1 Betaine aldehyde dehydrogenase [Aeromicrobium sp. 9AM]